MKNISNSNRKWQKTSKFQSFYASFVKFSTDFVDWNVEKSQQGTNLLSSSLFRRDLGRKISRWSAGILFEYECARHGSYALRCFKPRQTSVCSSVQCHSFIGLPTEVIWSPFHSVGFVLLSLRPVNLGVILLCFCPSDTVLFEKLGLLVSGIVDVDHCFTYLHFSSLPTVIIMTSSIHDGCSITRVVYTRSWKSSSVFACQCNCKSRKTVKTLSAWIWKCTSSSNVRKFNLSKCILEFLSFC